jgi:putative transposase
MLMRNHDLSNRDKGRDRLSRFDCLRSATWFVTVCTHNRECLFGRITDDRMRLTPAGETVVETWEEIPERYPGVQLDAFVVMPNHVHGIIRIASDVDAAVRNLLRSRPSGAEAASGRDRLREEGKSILLALALGYFRATTVERVNRLRAVPGVPLWRRNDYQRAVRDDADLTLMCEYIWNNPAQWDFDRENPEYLRTNAGPRMQIAAGIGGPVCARL